MYKKIESSCKIKDLATGKYFQEKVFHEAGLNLIYKSWLGQWLQTSFILSLISKVYGFRYNSKNSVTQVNRFVEKYGIQTEDFELQNIGSFNDFFSRAFKPGARSFSGQTREFAAFAEGRYFFYDKIDVEELFEVKGQQISLTQLLNKSKPDLLSFTGGLLICCRLAPQDYHRFHFPVAGQIQESYSVSGRLDSVGPVAQSVKSQIFLKNYRQVTFCSCLLYTSDAADE